MACISSSKIDIMFNNHNSKKIININKIANTFSKKYLMKKKILRNLD